MTLPSWKLIDRLAGPLATLIAVASADLLAPWVSVSLAIPFVALTWTAFIGGIYSAGVSATIIIVYALHEYPPDWGRTIQVTIGTIAIAAMVCYLKREAQLSQSLNGNLKRLKEAVELTRQLQVEWCDLSDQGRLKRIELLNDKLGNLAALVYGWHAIRREMNETQQKLGMKDE